MGCIVIDSSDYCEPLSEIEVMVRSAANYVQVSKDLRPRVLDAARLTSGERRVRRFIHQAALMAALLTWCVTTSVNRLDMRDDLRELNLGALEGRADHELWNYFAQQANAEGGLSGMHDVVFPGGEFVSKSGRPLTLANTYKVMRHKQVK